MNDIDYPFLSKGTSWLLESPNLAIKTADKTLINQAWTCIPKDIIKFFIKEDLQSNEMKVITLNISGNVYDTTIRKRPDGRYKLNLTSVKKELFIEELLIKKDKLWFEKEPNEKSYFYLYSKTENHLHSIKPKIKNKPVGNRTRQAEVELRIGQAYFKSEVSDICNNRCVVTGVKDLVPSILIGSHIKSWKDSNDDEKLDGYNGLLLAPHIDKLFDKHQITFDENGKIIALNNDIKNVLDCWGIDINQSYCLTKSHQKYLKHHRAKFNSK